MLHSLILWQSLCLYFSTILFQKFKVGWDHIQKYRLGFNSKCSFVCSMEHFSVHFCCCSSCLLPEVACTGMLQSAWQNDCVFAPKWDWNSWRDVSVLHELPFNNNVKIHPNYLIILEASSASGSAQYLLARIRHASADSIWDTKGKSKHEEQPDFFLTLPETWPSLH